MAHISTHVAAGPGGPVRPYGPAAAAAKRVVAAAFVVNAMLVAAATIIKKYFINHPTNACSCYACITLA